jgi:protein-disulfide isomerase
MAKEKKSSNDEIVISLDQFAVPGAIILAGVIIALAVFLTGRNGSDNTVNDGSEDTVAGDESDAESTGEYTFENSSTTLGNGPILGNRENAQLAIVEFSDYRCSYCQRHMEETLPSLLENYVDTGEVIYSFRDFPIYGDDIANAAKCIYHLEGEDSYKDFHTSAFNAEDDDAIYEIASEVGVDEGDFDACYSSTEYQDEVDSDNQAAQDAGLQGTPGFIVGTFDEEGNVTGKFIPGAYPYDAFVEVINSFLSE